MTFGKLILLLAIVALSYGVWQKYQSAPAAQTASATASAPGANGFVALPSPVNANPNVVLVIAPEECTEDDAQRAEALARQLASRSIPHARTDNVNFNFPDPDPEVVARLNSVMNGPIPIVFVNGKGKANPTLEEIISEYNAAR